MKNTKHLKLFILPLLLLAVTVTAFSLKNQENKSWNQPVSACITELENFEGTSEFFYKAGDERTWHVINRYSSGLSQDFPACNNSEYVFTSDTVTVINDYVGISRDEFISNKQIAEIN